MNQNAYWLTEKEDMAIVSSILKKHNLSMNMPVSIVNINKESVPFDDSKTPVWLNEIKENFLNLYGFEYGLAILLNVMTKWILKTKTIH